MPRPFSSSDEQWMAHALALARRGEALASPNPMVGAVLVRNQQMVGEGFHTYDGLRHAEIIALEAAGSEARRATLYVNLEPCCTTGRTGPCARALLEAGVARVVAAMPDPNPLVSGRSFKKLRAAGVEVETGQLFEEAQRLNEAFAVWIRERRPLVTLKSAMTLDGSLVLPRARAGARGRGGRRSRWITSAMSRAEVQRMRHASDALLTGIGTVLADDPMLTDRTGLPRRRRLLRVVVDSRLRLPNRSRLVRSAREDVLVFTRASDAGKQARALRRAGVEVVRVPGHAGRTGHIDLRAVLAELGRRSIMSVLLEAGPTLNEAALDAGIVDKVRMFYAPRIAGSPPAARQVTVLQKTATRAHRLREISGMRIEQFGPDFAIEGYLRDVYRNR
jgi:diaminohydroxyphosphoribosylaminopyrimidine deaminase / 5-amino-6-(5-phosphoribosylamino)uracil reductase